MYVRPLQEDLVLFSAELYAYGLQKEYAVGSVAELSLPDILNFIFLGELDERAYEKGVDS